MLNMEDVILKQIDYDAISSRCERTLRGSSKPKIPNYGNFRGAESKVNSVVTSNQFVASKVEKVYTGTAMLGIGTLHKGNAVPVFSEQDAVDISRMRR
jgi:hypothetical protein